MVSPFTDHRPWPFPFRLIATLNEWIFSHLIGTYCNFVMILFIDDSNYFLKAITYNSNARIRPPYNLPNVLFITYVVLLVIMCFHTINPGAFPKIPVCISRSAHLLTSSSFNPTCEVSIFVHYFKSWCNLFILQQGVDIKYQL